LIGILQVRLNRFPVEPFPGEDAPNSGGLFTRFVFVVNVYQLRVYRPLPDGSVALTQTLYVVEDARLERLNDLVPLLLVPLMVCPLLHLIAQSMLFPSGSLIGMLQLKLNEFPVEPFVGEGAPKTGGVFITAV
jgi:hypothetical protein